MESRNTRGEWGWNVPPPLLDTALALVLTAVVQVEMARAQGNPIVGAAALLITLPLIWRRRWPLRVFAAVVGGVIITFTSFATFDPAVVYPPIVALLIAAYSVGIHSQSRLIAAVVLVGTATLVAVRFGGGDLPPLPGGVLPYVLLLIPFLMGQVLRARQLRVDAFRERAIRLEQEQEFAAQMARNEERSRIARELHDVVAHTVSVMVVQAGAARRIVETAPDQAVEALSAVETTGREAMTELRHLLGALRPEDGEAPLAPKPGIAQLPALIQRVRDAGLPAELQVTGTPRTLAAGIDLTAYRIVQEALTNTIKHAGSVRAQIALDYRDDALKVEVLDEGTGQSLLPRASAGRGLAGMRDRVALLGGTLEAGPRLGRGFAVRAWLPLAGDEP